MITSKKGYRDILDFTNDAEMRSNYFGLIARGKRFYLSCYVNVNEGSQKLHELTKDEAIQIQKDWKRDGWSERFVDRWIIGGGIV